MYFSFLFGGPYIQIYIHINMYIQDLIKSFIEHMCALDDTTFLLSVSELHLFLDRDPDLEIKIQVAA